MRHEPFKTRVVNVRIKRDWTPRFSDHAMLRYIERVHHIDIDGLKKTLATDALRTAIVFGHGSVKNPECTWIIERGRIVTALSRSMRAKPPKAVTSSKRAERLMQEASA